ncbi:hypothetical protein TEA_025863 [Camellia sinensis var. sinensis]|uniref:isoleucine--tRNA ligase n=1 Tax=Camellia sinensis var. sinensis TaxID=542762 RepID=A0A4S4DVK5_CAMSN|nr:hypothetical protein TEA_025863 [Camellia sinensis var. sinensis]
MDDVCEGKDFSFSYQEEKILQWWTEIHAFETQLDRTKDFPEYIFYDGPPFATGLPHYGHILAGTIKDIVTRYQTMRGHHVTRRFGWDCHGLPVEFEIDKKLGIKTRDDVLKMGIGNYNEECRSIVTRYVEEWETIVTRTGRWIDFRNDYKTMDLKFMETVWWVFSQLFEKDLVYRGFKVMPYSTGCKTPLSNFEANSNYKEVPDPEIMVSFPIVGDPQGAAFVAWTTTPWTLPSNLGLCVNANFVYVKVRNKFNGKIYVVAESRLSELPVEKPKKNISNGSVNESENSNSKTKGSSGGKSKNVVDTYEVLDKFSGASLVGTKAAIEVCIRALVRLNEDRGGGRNLSLVRYVPLFDYFMDFSDVAFRVLADDFVTSDSGTGVVHMAPAFGEDDYRVCTENQIIIKDNGRLVKIGSLTHSYPFCWRSDTPLIYRAVPSWFVAVERLKDQLLENNKQTYWVPDFVKEKRFHNWLENARDWAVSRSRFWGTPLPVWVSDDGEETIVMDSVDKLQKLSGVEVFDCWFESGSMPYAYIHYPFENVELFENNFPGHFVAEGLDQTRGWFYTLMVLSTALFGKPAFKNLICNGLVLAEDGKKMSKRLKNYPSPMEVINDYGADALRLYIINSPVVRAEPLRFKKDGVYGVIKDVFLPWYNAYRFLVQNAKRLEVEGLAPFIPIDQVTLQKSSNVLDQWINSATQSLVHFVRQEMDGYRLYTVCGIAGFLFESLGFSSSEFVSYPCAVLLTSCKAMAPFTPFFTEVLYQNLRKVSDGSEESIHYCGFPEEEGKGGERIEQSVRRMMTIIDLARNIRERHNKPLKSPLKEMVVVHPDAEFLDDIAGKLKEYVLEELNVKSIVPCNDPLKYASLRAEPEFSVLGKRLGKSMPVVAKAVKAMSQEDILAFEKSGQITVATHSLKLTDIKIVRGFKLPDNMTEQEVDAAGDGDVLVILDLRPDESLLEAGVAREVVNRIQKLRKKAGLEPTDLVEVYFRSLDKDPSISQQILNSQESYIRDSVGSCLLPSTILPPHAVILDEETFHGISDLSFTITLARQSLVFNSDAVLALCEGKTKFANGLQTYLLSRDHHNLKSEFQLGNRKIKVDCIENQPAVDVVLGEHLFLTVGDYFLSTKT